MTNLDRNGPAKSWTWSGGPVQARAFDLDGRQTSYPYTGAGTVNGLRPPRLPYDLGNRIKNLSGTLTEAYGHDGPRPPGKLDRLATYSNEVYAYGATGNRPSMMFCQCAAREIRERDGFGMARLSGCSADCIRHTFFGAVLRSAPRLPPGKAWPDRQWPEASG